jgi:hypothetical protein
MLPALPGQGAVLLSVFTGAGTGAQRARARRAGGVIPLVYFRRKGWL